MDIDTLWLRTLEEVVNRAAHEIKDSLNGVSLNVEVLRSRAGRAGATADGLSAFATSAAEQLELLSTRAEAVLFLARPPREPADVALALQHLAALLTPAAKADGKRLLVDGYGRSTPTSATAQATRFALAAGLLSLIRDGAPGRCTLENNGETVVRFSHESAGTCSLQPAVSAAIEAHSIRIDRSGSDLILRFPRTS
ncbi:MAG TPA: hypothetical protein VKH19_14920 [Gemmatimonadaceae bacterium]|nr:hypothetical protein [Gemmatimonadaceae bacterium]